MYVANNTPQAPTTVTITENQTVYVIETSNETSIKKSAEMVMVTSTGNVNETLTEMSTTVVTATFTANVTETLTEISIITVKETSTEFNDCNVTVTTTNTGSGVCFQSSADPPPTNTSISTPDGLQTDSSSFGVGSIIAVVLGVILLVQLIACTVAWVVCLKRKQRRTKGGQGKIIVYTCNVWSAHIVI